MIFWKQSPKLELRCYTGSQELIDLFPITEARQSFPEWIEKIPPTVKLNPHHEVETLRVCPGVNDFYKRGVTLPLWQDHRVVWDHEKLLTVTTPSARHNEVWNSHPHHQYPGGLNEQVNIKLTSPWFFETDRMVPFIMVDPVWHKPNPMDYVIPPGTIEFKYQRSTNVIAFLPKVEQPSEIELRAGQPIVNFIPLENVNISIKHIVMSPDEFARQRSWQWTFDRLYLRTRKLLEKKNGNPT